MELLDHVADKELQEKLRAYVEGLHQEIKELRLEKKKLQKKSHKRDPNPLNVDFSPTIQRRLSSDSFRSTTGWVGHVCSSRRCFLYI